MTSADGLQEMWRREEARKEEAPCGDIGYRDGITAGKEASAQGGFNDGYKESVHDGYCRGLVRGISSAISSFPDQLKEKLTSNLANKDRFQVLLESTRAISSNDALQIFYRSLQQNGCGNSEVLVEDCSSNQLETHFSKLNHILNNSPEIKVDLGLGSRKKQIPAGCFTARSILYGARVLTNNSQSTVFASPASMILAKRASYGMSSSFMLGPAFVLCSSHCDRLHDAGAALP
ncbi:hypothetical protein KSP40_PGU009086 [Platanthera guangdongensis]|uniref:Essential protein Yae1 N-terminal domain-containing protein n=1 Tax=Platanthera guangdongensis TaxID=2320717 RepID=A0ABR2M7G1_9ASPA